MTDDLRVNTTDYVVATAKAVLGTAPFAGSLLEELAGTIIPKQRLARVADFARRLEHKIGQLDKDAVRAMLADENFTDLFEETARHAARAVTEERREYLSSLLASGVLESRVSFIESKHLLRILGEINDIEVIWLRFYLVPYASGDDAFRTQHSAVLADIEANGSSGQSTLDRDALQQNYIQHLVSIGLLERLMHIDPKSGYPIVDRVSGNWKSRGYHVTALGELLLRYIGMWREA